MLNKPYVAQKYLSILNLENNVTDVMKMALVCYFMTQDTRVHVVFGELRGSK